MGHVWGAVLQYDVFLKPNQADKLRVRRLAERLRAAGRRVWLDEWTAPVAASRQSAAFSGGKHGTRQEEDGGALPRRRYDLAIERGLVLCLSPAALGSDWVGRERSTGLFRDPAYSDQVDHTTTSEIAQCSQIGCGTRWPTV